MALSRLLSGAAVRPVAESGGDPEIRGIRLDSRRVREGDLFCAIRGFNVDGVAFVPQAVERGAAAVLAETARPRDLDPAVAWVQVADARRATGLAAREWHGRPDEAMTLVGITGTNGKTSVAWLLESMIHASGRSAGRIGTVGHAFGGRAHPAERTTPEAPELFGLLATMRDAGVEIVAMEVSSHALGLGRVEGTRFAVGAFLNLTRDHLDFHQSMESYFDAKAGLVRGLEPDAVAVLPADDPRGGELSGLTRARVVTFGRNEGATVRIVREESSLDGSRAVLESPVGEIAVDSPLIGSFALDNIAAAAACALSVGLDGETITRGVQNLHTLPGRMETIAMGQPFAVIVDYAHTEHALERVLSAVRELATGRVIVVFGCGGNRDHGKRPVMGRVAAELADVVFLTSDNPRGEDPRTILEEIEQGVLAVAGAAGGHHIVPDRRDAIERAVREAEADDAVVVAGKGHETSQSFGDRVEAFDDREIARETLIAAGWTGGCRAGA
jgi:UDP-N-acetylmuramoyl-L-alanyl-D-glutamate--2,6-diaminopimelate ligase